MNDRLIWHNRRVTYNYSNLTNSSKFILGCDIGSRNNGFGLIELNTETKEVKYVTAYNHHLEAALMSERLLDLENVLLALVDNYDIKCLAYENPVVRGKGGVDLQHICAIHKLVVAKRKLEFKQYSPSEVKKVVTGKGAADKFFVARRVNEILGIDKDYCKNNHDSDALAVALCYASKTADLQFINSKTK